MKYFAASAVCGSVKGNDWYALSRTIDASAGSGVALVMPMATVRRPWSATTLARGVSAAA